MSMEPTMYERNIQACRDRDAVAGIQQRADTLNQIDCRGFGYASALATAE